MIVKILWIDTNYMSLETFLDLSKASFFFPLQNGDDRAYFINKLIQVMYLEQFA